MKFDNWVRKESLIKASENKILDIENDDIYKKCVEAMENNSEIARLKSLIKNEFGYFSLNWKRLKNKDELIS